MKSMMQIAIECGTRYNAIRDIVKKEKIIGTKVKRIDRQSVFFDKYQQEIIHQVLYFEGKMSELTIASKMNLIND